MRDVINPLAEPEPCAHSPAESERKKPIFTDFLFIENWSVIILKSKLSNKPKIPKN
jgi:hypothetical protein